MRDEEWYSGVSFGIVMALAMAGEPGAAKANVQVEVDVGSQTMEVYVNGRLRHTWRVSTGRRRI